MPPGGILRIPQGLYVLSSSLVLRSGTTIEAPQATLTNGPKWREATGDGPGIGPGYALVTNENHRAASITDNNLRIIGLSCAYAGPPRGQAHAVQFRMVNNIVVEGCHFRGGGNGTAFLACQDTEVSYSTAEATYNAGFDHWEGPRKARVHDCVVFCAQGYGILFTGAGTDLSAEQRAGVGFTARFNHIVHPTEAGIWIAALSPTSPVSDIIVDRNVVDVAGTGASGIGISGAASNATI